MLMLDFLGRDGGDDDAGARFGCTGLGLAIARRLVASFAIAVASATAAAAAALALTSFGRCGGFALGCGCGLADDSGITTFDRRRAFLGATFTAVAATATTAATTVAALAFRAIALGRCAASRRIDE
ncbi:MAG: hypothetical protein KGJ30_13605, partial [Burkholderiales bacterium]|nr:hypothetical protein [Burkholderiales bacterium]